MNKVPLYGKCCFCEKIREAADTDTTVLYGQTVDLYYCAPCLGMEEEAIEVEIEKTIDFRYLSFKEVKDAGETPTSLILEAMLEATGISKVGINQSINESWGGFLRPNSIDRALKEIARSGLVEEVKQLGKVKLYRLSEAYFKNRVQAEAFGIKPGQRLSFKQIKEIGETPDSIVLNVIAKGSNTRKQINKAINIRFAGCLRNELLTTALSRLICDGAIVEAGNGSEKSYYIAAKRQRSAGGVA